MRPFGATCGRRRAAKRSLNRTANPPILLSVSAQPNQSPKPSKVGKTTYRGVTLQTPAAASRFSSVEVKRAVEHALAKHAGALKKRK